MFKISEKSSKIKIERAEDENKKKFTCPLCSRSKLSTSLEAFNESHVCPKNPNKKRGKKVYVCSICEKSCRDVVDWRRHELTHSNERPFACEMCGKTYKAERLLKDHLAGHTALIDCEFCQLKIEGTDNYKEHVKLVHQEKVGCTVCRMTFLGQKRLENHMRIHSSEKQFVCEICGVSYPFQKSLFNHMNLVHKEIGKNNEIVL
jgi:transcription elongation factor Elf1